MTIFDKMLRYGRVETYPPAVLVTGPQRSGTRIAAKMCAADLGYTYYDERAFDVGNLTSAISIMHRGGVVLHGPALCAESHLLWDPRLVRLNVATIVVRRSLREIIVSCERIKWKAAGEIKKYLSRPEFGPYLTAGAHVAQWKYEVYDGYQRPVMQAMTSGCSGPPAYLTIDYGDLSAHELWVPPDERDGWEWDQTERSPQCAP